MRLTFIFGFLALLLATPTLANMKNGTDACGGALYYDAFFNETNITSRANGDVLLYNLTPCTSEKYFSVLSYVRDTNNTAGEPSVMLYKSDNGGSTLSSIIGAVRYAASVRRLETTWGIVTNNSFTPSNIIFRLGTTITANTLTNDTQRRIIIFSAPNTSIGENFSYNSTATSNQNTVFGDVGADTRKMYFQPSQDGEVLVWASAIMNSDTTTGAATMRLQMNGTTLGAVKNASVGQIIKRDVATTETGQPHNIIGVVTASSGGVQNVTLQIAGTRFSSNTTDTDETSLSTLPLWYYSNYTMNKSAALLSTTSTSTVPLITLFIPANTSFVNRTYAIIGYINWNLSSTTPHLLSELRVDNVVNSSDRQNIGNVADVLASTHATLVTLNSSQNHTLSLNWSLSSAGTAWSANTLLLAIEVNNTPTPAAPPATPVTKTIWNDTFATDAGWTGGTYDSGNQWYDTTGSFGTWTSPDYDIANFTWVRWCSQQYILSAHQTLKLYIGETTGTTSDPHAMVDSGYVTKPEPGYTPDYTGSYGGWHEFCIEMNETNDKLEFFYDGTSRWSYTGTAFDFASGEDYLRIAVGNLNGASEYRIDNSTVTVLCSELPSGACDEPAGDTCTCTGTANCVLDTSTCTATTANIDVGGYNLTIQGGGTFLIAHNITNLHWGFIRATWVRINTATGGFRW